MRLYLNVERLATMRANMGCSLLHLIGEKIPNVTPYCLGDSLERSDRWITAKRLGQGNTAYPYFSGNRLDSKPFFFDNGFYLHDRKIKYLHKYKEQKQKTKPMYDYILNS